MRTMAHDLESGNFLAKVMKIVTFLFLRKDCFPRPKEGIGALEPSAPQFEAR